MNDWLIVSFPFVALLALLAWSVYRERGIAKDLYRYIHEGRLVDVKTILSSQNFSNIRETVLKKAIEISADSKQPEILTFLLSKELKSPSHLQKFDNFLYHQYQKGGWRSVLLWRMRTSHPFEPWRDISEPDKTALITRACKPK